MKTSKFRTKRKGELKENRHKDRRSATKLYQASESDEEQERWKHHHMLRNTPKNHSSDQDQLEIEEDPLPFGSYNDLAILRANHLDPDRHFNPPEIMTEYSLPDRFKVGKRHHRAHNLKNIACHILRLVSSNSYLTVKQIAFVLFQIMGHTSLGKQIIQRQYPTLDINLIKVLTVKYKEGKVESLLMNMVVKNVRRRLYDALNVMMAADVLTKRYNGTFLALDSKPKMKEEKTLDPLEEEQQTIKIQHDYQHNSLSDQIRNMEKRLIKKRKMLKERKEVLSKLTYFMERNQFQIQEHLFFLPMLVVTSSAPIIVSLEKENVTLNSKSSLKFSSDMDIIDMILMKEGVKSHRNGSMEALLE